MTLTDREFATVLAALRFWQPNMSESELEECSGMGHFYDVSPLTHDEIDALCDKLNSEPSEDTNA